MKRRAFTLLETVASITVLSVVAAVVMPVMSSATDAYASACTTRETVERVAFAIDRCVRLLRDAPAGETDGTIGLTSATINSVRFSDERGLQLTDGVLYLRIDDELSPLCRDVTKFELEYIASDGTTSVLATPTLTQRFIVTIEAGGLELTSVATPRIGAPI